jgi:glycosyltransferase involved in cell wall biosynthesis
MGRKKVKRILIETASFDTGGLERVVLDSALILRNFGFEVTIFCTGPLGLLASEARDEGLRVLRVRTKLKLIFHVLFKRPDVSLSHFADFGYSVYNIFKIPNITFIHNVYAFLDESKKQKILKNDKHVTRYISVSNSATRYAVESIKLEPNKIATIPNGINTEKHGLKVDSTKSFSFPLQESIGDDDFVFLNVAAYNLHKGHYLLVDALKQVVTKYPQTRVVCIGSTVYQPHLDDLKRVISEEKLDENLLLAGYFPDTTPFYLRANCFLLPSFIEGWSIAMTEAMFYQLPMILTQTGGAAEVIEDNDIGILIPNEYGDVANLDLESLNSLSYFPQSYKTTGDLTDAMINMIEDEQKWRVQAKASREKVLMSYNLQKVVRDYVNEIQFVIESKHKRVMND